ncbi:R3H domain-containing protein 2 [Camelus dromedarius]|uniref:R3H domain-containing protein 2 n=1 Tax=Camelus dromedarius TaxID=9838 RepID=A0A5N4CCB7_CAMDR|nr:R3H domain-containing protein 2 [Camelus dromedarius]
MIPPAQQNGTSPSAGFLQPPGSEQYQMPQLPSPCSPPQMPQQYSGVSPSGPGVVVMQLNVLSGAQVPQNPSMVQWSHCKYYNMDQWGQKPGDLYSPDSSPQANTQMSSSPVTSPTQSPAPSPVTSLSSVCTGLSPLPVLTQFPQPGGPAQGDGRYSLLGQPLQYNLSICPPLLHGQSAYTGHKGQSGLKHGNWSKRRALKSAPTDLGTTDVLGRVLEVTDLPEGITDVDKLFTQLAMSSTKIQWLKDAQGLPGGGGRQRPLAAQNASLHLNNSVSHFKLQVTKKNYDMRILEQASSQ